MSNTVKLSKDWLLKLTQQRPEKRTEYKDSENKFLRAVHHTSGMVKLCVYKCPKGQKSAVRVGLPFSVNNALPNMQRLRTEANKIILQLDQGHNPNSGRSLRSGALTLQQALDNYLEGSTNTARVNINWRNAISGHLANWLSEPLACLCTPKRIFAMHRRIMALVGKENANKGVSGDGGIAANEVMKKLRRILNFNRALDRSLNLPHWPSEELGGSGLKMWIEQRPRTRRIHREEFPVFWRALEAVECDIQRDLFKFLLLTGCRSGEARKLTSSDVNIHRWTVTFSNTKNGLDHTLPLTKTLKALVLNRISNSFDGRLFPLFDPKTVTKHLERHCKLHVTPHDLRRTFAGVAEVAGIGSTIKKDLLNHLSGRDVTDDYTGQTDIDDLRNALESIESQMMDFI